MTPRKKRRIYNERVSIKAKRNLQYFKPPKFKDHLTLAELCEKIGKDPSWIRVLEAEGRIPKAARVKRGKLEIRLWSPEQVEEIAAIIARHRPGRPRKAESNV
jgi:hypothetical protein